MDRQHVKPDIFSGRASAIRGLQTFDSSQAFLSAAERDLAMPSGTSGDFMRDGRLIAGGNGLHLNYHHAIGNGTTDMFRPFPGCIVHLHCGRFFDPDLMNSMPTKRPLSGESYLINLFDEGGFKVRTGERMIDITPRHNLAFRVPNDANVDYWFAPNVAHRHLQIVFGPEGVQNIAKYLGLPVPTVFSRLASAETSENLAVVKRRPSAIQHFVESLWAHEVDGFLQGAMMRMKVAELLCLLDEDRDDDLDEGCEVPTFLESRKLNDARKLLEESFCRPPTIAALAAEVGLNRRKLTEGFKQLFGTSIGAFCRERRLEKAHEMLTESILPISEVAAEVGYAHMSSFTKAFTEHFGYAPMTTRNGQFGNQRLKQ